MLDPTATSVILVLAAFIIHLYIWVLVEKIDTFFTIVLDVLFELSQVLKIRSLGTIKYRLFLNNRFWEVKSV